MREMLAEHLSTRGTRSLEPTAGSLPMRRVGVMSASENLERPEWVVSSRFNRFDTRLGSMQGVSRFRRLEVRIIS